MMHKKGISLIGEHTVNIVISAIVIIFLVAVAYTTYHLLTTKTDQKKIEEQFANLVYVIQQVHEKEQTQTVLLFPPNLWYLRGFPNYDFPEGECRSAVGCICICDEEYCRTQKKCEGFSYDVQLMEGLTSTDVGGIEGPGATTTTQGAIRFTRPAVEFRVVHEKEQNRIALYEVKKNG